MQPEQPEAIIERLEKENAELRRKLEHACADAPERTGIERQREAERQMQLLDRAVNQSSDCVHLVDAQGRICFANTAFCCVLGYERDEILRMCVFDYAPDFPFEHVVGLVANLPVGSSQNFEGRARRRDGQLLHVETSISLIEFGGERFGLAISRDITERKRMEQALKESEARYRHNSNLLHSMLESASDVGVWTLDRDYCYLFFNAKFREDTKRLRGVDIAIGMSMLDSIGNEEFRALCRQSLDRVLTGHSHAVEMREEVMQDGCLTYEYYEHYGSPILNDVGEVTGVTIISHNTTARKRMEAANQQLAADLAATLQALPDPLFEVDRSGCYLNIWSQNPRLLARQRELMLGRTVAEVLAPDVAEAAMAALREADETGRSYGKILAIDQPDGTRFFEQSIAKKTVADGSDPRFMVISRDITKRKRIEEELQNKNSELERFTYTVSHDLKSPLVTIKTFSGSVLHDLASGRHDRIEIDLNRICTAADKMALLLDDLLKLSRFGYAISAPEPVNMAQLVESVLATMAGTLEENNIPVDVLPGLPLVVCDRQRMLEVVQNLIDNAVKYRGDQPEPRICIGVRDEAERKVFYVHDNGPGIEPKYHDNIFGLFNRINTRVPGTGIGLALVKRIVETHCGKVWVESDGQGNGCTFCFTVGEGVY